MRYLIGIDVGTTGAKALLIDEKGKIIAKDSQEYPLLTPKIGWAEQNPEDWWKATRRAIGEVLKSSGVDATDVKGIGLSGQMHGAVFLDKKGKVLRPAILWCDQRTQEECRKINEIVGEQKVLELTSNPVLTGFTAPKILWVRKHQPKIYENADKILLPKDYIRYRLTGVFASEVSDASGTSLFNVRERKWSKEMLRKLGIDSSLLPPVYESKEISGRINKRAAIEMALAEGTPVVGGAGDQAAGGLGNGIVEKGIVSFTIGTSGVIFAHSERAKVDQAGRVHTFCHAVEKAWHIMGVMLSAGGSLRWFRDNFCEEEIKEARMKGIDPYELITEKAKKVSPGSQGLIFLPYLMGERTPHKDARARGGFFGLTASHKKEHLIRSIMEGVVFGLRDSLEILKEMGIEIKEIRASGGGARSSLWCQIAADILGKKVFRTNIEEAPAYGVALLAGVGSGIFENIREACKRTIKVTEIMEPTPENVEKYKRYYPIYHSLYPILKTSFDKV